MTTVPMFCTDTLLTLTPLTVYPLPLPLTNSNGSYGLSRMAPPL